MTEKLLQFIWQFQYLNKNGLCTTLGEPVNIIHPGQPNAHQGPDFFNGRVKIGAQEWAGHIELHLKSSDWFRHKHQTDPVYGKVILHVVWIHDSEVTDENGQHIPVIELKGRIAGLLLNQYEQWMNTPRQIPCGNGLPSIDTLTWQHWLDRLLAERLLEKCSRVSKQLQVTENHWEEICWQLVCAYFGGPVNKESFRQIAVSLPLKILSRHRNVVPQIEALLLGQSGLLHKNFTGSYPQMLFREYQFLQKKYGLQVVNKPPVYLRMRPTEFPPIRLAQVAMILHKRENLFSRLLDCKDINEVRLLFDVTANDYWNEHFKPDAASGFQPKRTGKMLIDRVIINAVIPVLFSYGHHHLNDELRERVLGWLAAMPAESNTHTKIFANLGKKPANAGESQAMITLKQEYCDAKRCLDCSVGNQLLKQKSRELTIGT